ncbi:hypothetical protein QP166_05120 [Sphingomonas sp. LR60]|uniref:hypothetical protein n=1 Tax=Sphingomonas sp. LR60 TaxID=3050233 RepID=UPI002FDFD10D
MRKVLAGRAFLFIAAVSATFVSIPLGLWAYERYQTQQLLNNNVARAADDYADAVRNLNDQLERFQKQK